MIARRRTLVAFAVAAASVATVGWLRTQPETWLINESGSLPRGLYQRTPAGPYVGAVVAAAPPPSAKAYLATLGAGDEARLLKRVAAGPGETVCRRGARVSWPRGAVLARRADRRGRPLPVWSGCRPLGPDELLLVGDTANSFDSRYFGPIREGALQGVYREVWRW